MIKARIVIGANYGDEGKGTVVAKYTKSSEGSVLNILTNGGAQRGHSILTEDGNITFHHFGSGTYHGADNYYSRFFILNPMQFVKEYDELIVKPKNIYRDSRCRWSTPYDSIANLITEQMLKRHASCCMGIWNTIKRSSRTNIVSLDQFVNMDDPYTYLEDVKKYYEREITIPKEFSDIWNSPILKQHFLNDCRFMVSITKTVNDLSHLSYDNLIFENGQGLMLCDKGEDTYDTTPSNTGILYATELLKDVQDIDITAHYVTRPYMTRHGDGHLSEEMMSLESLSKDVTPDRTNHYNDFQGEFRYGLLDIKSLERRIREDVMGHKFEIELTHCDEMDRVVQFKKQFETVNTFDSALIK